MLDSASQGLLASSLAADDPRKKGIGYDKSREPFFKHRCRYCGKVTCIRDKTFTTVSIPIKTNKF